MLSTYDYTNTEKIIIQLTMFTALMLRNLLQTHFYNYWKKRGWSNQILFYSRILIVYDVSCLAIFVPLCVHVSGVISRSITLVICIWFPFLPKCTKRQFT